MNVVVNFLSTLVSDESNGSIKRMLGLCGEFERIAKVVLDKAERESHSKKKRKTAPDDTATSQPQQRSAPQPSSSRNTAGAPPTTAPLSSPLFSNDATPNGQTNGQSNGQTAFSPSTAMPTDTGLPGDLPSNVNTMPGLGQDFQEMLSPNNLGNVGFDQPFGGAGNNTMSSFQQPFVPQDLWQMPMTIEWDWADMSSNFPVFDSRMDSNGPPPPNES